MGTYICPYCFTKNDEKGIEYRCRNAYCKQPPEKDSKYNNYWKTSLSANKAFSIANGSLRGTAKCPYCGEETTIRLCQTCHSELPHTFGSFQDETFSVIGVKNSGKTHYIAMLLKMFGKRISESFNVSMEIVHDEISKKFRDYYATPIDNRKVILESVSGKASAEIRRPLIYKLSFRKKGFWGGKKLNIATISLFDNAGEDLFYENTIRNISKCIFNSTGIILIIDPLQLPKVHMELKSRNVALPEIQGNTNEMLTRVAKVIREHNKINEDELIDTPVAITFSKIDMLKDIIGENNSMIFQEFNHNEFLDRNVITGTSNEIESFLRLWDDTGLVTQIKNNFKNYCFFGFTALGSNPEGGVIKQLRPSKVENPFLWLLHKRNLIDMK